MNVTVSVIIPNYNHEIYLKQRIDSVLNQTYRNFEVIILDDNSSDCSREIIESYRFHEKIKHIVYNDINVGNTFKQWIKGVDLSKGDLIWIAESDDYCEKIFLEELVYQFNENTALAYCQSSFVDGNDIVYQSNAKFIYQYYEGNFFVENFMLYGNSIFNASMCIWKKSYFDNVSREFFKYRLWGDYIFWVEMAIQGDVLVSGKVLNYYRRHQATVSTHLSKQEISVKEELFALSYLLKFCKVFKTHLADILYKKVFDNFDNKIFLSVFLENSKQIPEFRHLIERAIHQIKLKKKWIGLKKPINRIVKTFFNV